MAALTYIHDRSTLVRSTSPSLPQNVWRPFGIGNWNEEPGFRLNAIAVDANYSSHIYVGCDNGTLYKTTDGGRSWERLAAGHQSTPIGSITLDPTGSTIYIATGQGLTALDGVQLWTTDGGATFTPPLPADLFDQVSLENLLALQSQH